jgi:hypothetical protein
VRLVANLEDVVTVHKAKARKGGLKVVDGLGEAKRVGKCEARVS